MALHKLQVYKLGIDLIAHDPVVILTDEGQTHSLPITIGVFEATAIALAMEGTEVPRPTSHDLIKTVIDSLGATLREVVITKVVRSTFYAKLVLVREDGTELEIDARPSDSIAIALRANAPIYAEEELLYAEGIKGITFDVPASDEDVFYIGQTSGPRPPEAEESAPPEEESDSLVDDDLALEQFIQNLNPNDFESGDEG